MTKLSVYFKVAWACKTPLVFMADKQYKAISEHSIKLVIGAAKRAFKTYKKEFRDCDDAAVIFDAEASKKAENGVGQVYGYWRGHGWHYWSLVLKEDRSVEMIEPQNGNRNLKWGRYFPVVVTI
jgi:hypothetical protein